MLLAASAAASTATSEVIVHRTVRFCGDPENTLYVFAQAVKAGVGCLE